MLITTNSRTIRSLTFIGVAALLTLPAWAQTAKPSVPDDTRAYFEVLRSQFNADKVATLNQLLRLTSAEADKFWPIYRQYEKELAALGDRKLALVRQFFKQYTSTGLTQESSSEIAEKWLANLQDRTDLWKKYHRRISKDVSPVRAAQFLQIENQIALLMDLAIASEMPALAPGAGRSSK